MFTVIGTDRQTGEPVSMSVGLGSVPEAVEFGRSRGIDVREVRSPERAYAVTPAGVSVATATATPGLHPGMVLLSAAIPVVGVLAGAISIGTGRKGGVGMIVAAIAGLLLWGAALASL